MAEIIKHFEKENADVSHAGKLGSARKNVFGSVTNKSTKAMGTVTKKPKVLMDVKNTVYQRKNSASESNLKKQFVTKENQQLKTEKSTKNEAANNSHSVIRKIPIPSVTVTSDNTGIEKEIVLLPLPSEDYVSDDDDFDVDDCPTCLHNDDDDWLADLGQLKYSDKDLFNICSNPVPCTPSPEMNIDDWYNSQYEPISPISMVKCSEEHAFSPEFKLPSAFRNLCFDDISPVTYED